MCGYLLLFWRCVHCIGRGTSCASSPKKLHITKKFLFAQQMGTFVPEDVVKYCADPCYRVVARHALTTGGLTRQQQNRLMREYTMRVYDLAHAFVIVDPEKSRVLTFVGGVLTEKPIKNSQGVQL